MLSIAAPFLLLGLISVFLIFLIQRASIRRLVPLQRQLCSLEEKNSELLEQIDAQKMIASEQFKEMQRIVSHLEQELEEARLPLCPAEQDKQLIELRASHLQLKKQFEEKSAILHQTRKELFAAEGRVFVLQREKEEQEYTLCSEKQMLLESLKQYQEEYDTLEMELLLLEQLVSSLLFQKPKSTKRKKETEGDFFLMSFSNNPPFPLSSSQTER